MGWLQTPKEQFIYQISVAPLLAVIMVLFSNNSTYLSKVSIVQFLLLTTLLWISNSVFETNTLKFSKTEHIWKHRIHEFFFSPIFFAIFFPVLDLNSEINWQSVLFIVPAIAFVSVCFMILLPRFWENQIERIACLERYDTPNPVDQSLIGSIVFYGSMVAIYILFAAQILYNHLPPTNFFFIAITLYSTQRYFEFNSKLTISSYQYWYDRTPFWLGLISLALAFVISL